MFFSVFLCFLPFPYDSPCTCFSLFFYVFLCFPMFSPVSRWFPLFCPVFLCFPFSPSFSVFLCFPCFPVSVLLFSSVFPCFPMFSPVYIRFPLFSPVFLFFALFFCFPLFSPRPLTVVFSENHGKIGGIMGKHRNRKRKHIKTFLWHSLYSGHIMDSYMG